MKTMDQRQYPRVPVHYSVLTSNVTTPTPKKMHMIAENASRTGLKLLHSGLLRKNDQLKLEGTKLIDSKPITCYGKVMWDKESRLVYGEKIAGIHLTKIGWSETARLITPLDV